MAQDIRTRILQKLSARGAVTTAEIAAATGFSRGYIHRFFQALQSEGKILLVGKANEARYIPATKKAFRKAKEGVVEFRRLLRNEGLAEDLVLQDIKSTT